MQQQQKQQNVQKKQKNLCIASLEMPGNIIKCSQRATNRKLSKLSNTGWIVWLGCLGWTILQSRSIYSNWQQQQQRRIEQARVKRRRSDKSFIFRRNCTYIIALHVLLLATHRMYVICIYPSIQHPPINVCV